MPNKLQPELPLSPPYSITLAAGLTENLPLLPGCLPTLLEPSETPGKVLGTKEEGCKRQQFTGKREGVIFGESIRFSYSTVQTWVGEINS